LEKRMFFAHSATNKREEKGLHRGLYLLLLSAILALSASLNLSRLTSEEYANVYYAASVKNMLLRASVNRAHGRRDGRPSQR
jgi:hypothetical protein